MKQLLLLRQLLEMWRDAPPGPGETKARYGEVWRRTDELLDAIWRVTQAEDNDHGT